jgi:hypothetical protein
MPIRREGFSLSGGRGEEDFVGAYGAVPLLFLSQRRKERKARKGKKGKPKNK